MNVLWSNVQYPLLVAILNASGRSSGKSKMQIESAIRFACYVGLKICKILELTGTLTKKV